MILQFHGSGYGNRRTVLETFSKALNRLHYDCRASHRIHPVCTMSISRYKLPVIDLDEISEESELVPVVKSILADNDTFLLKNYANKETLNELVDFLNSEEPPDLGNKFDCNFTGVVPLDDNILFEQYIFNTDQDLVFNRDVDNIAFKKLYVRLFRIALFFSRLCLRSVGSTECKLNDSNYSSIIGRYYNSAGNAPQTLPTGEVFEYITGHNYKKFLPTGLLTVFPVANGVRFKPPTVGSNDDNTWVSINEENCLLLHTGTLLAQLSGGKHTTSALQISPDFNVIHLTVSLPLSTSNDKGDKLSDSLLRQQIEEFSEIAAQLYPRETSLLCLKNMVEFYKELFAVFETVLSLISILRSTVAPPELHSLLPQVSNMMRKKICEEDFLKMVSLWPQCYIIEANSRCELTVSVPKSVTASNFNNKSRRLQYVELADQWYAHTSNERNIPKDVPLWKINKRRGSSGTFDRKSIGITRTKPQPSNSKPTYLSNSKEKYMYPEKKHDSQDNLLQRLRDKERRSAALLSQRQRQYEQFLAVKIKQVFDILHSLQWGKPYTVTYLSSLIVDSLQDSNNPIGQTEAEEILARLQKILANEIFVQTVDGGLKVYRWDNLNKQTLETRIDDYKNQHRET